MDAFIAETARRVAELQTEVQSLRTENDQLRSAAAAAASPPATSEHSSDRATGVFRTAAHERRRAHHTSETGVRPRSWKPLRTKPSGSGRATSAERSALLDDRQAELQELFRREADQLAADTIKPGWSSDQLLAAARIEADASRSVAEQEARTLREAAQLDVELQRTAAQQEPPPRPRTWPISANRL